MSTHSEGTPYSASIIYFANLCSDLLIEQVRALQSRVVLVSDDNVSSLYATSLCEFLQAQQIQVDTLTFPAGESSKSREMKQYLEDRLFQLGCGRDTVLLALGGGVVTDLVGFVAATYCRGIPVIYLPTTLLAMVDAANGGKTGINTAYGKNVLGTFTQPRAIIIDVKTLNTLPMEEYLPAYAEVIKHALIADSDYFTMIESTWDALKAKKLDILTTVIQRSCAIKSAVVQADATEASKREILNFGHTVAHALEKASDYRIPHGLAVAAGLIAESQLSHQRGYLPTAALERIRKLVMKVGLPNLEGLSEDAILHALQADKKIRQGQLRCVLLQCIGDVARCGNAYAHPVDMSWFHGLVLSPELYSCAEDSAR